MAFEKYEGTEYKDDVYDQLKAETQRELGGLEKELSPYGVKADGHYVDGAFDDIHHDKENQIPEYEDTFDKDAIA